MKKRSTIEILYALQDSIWEEQTRRTPNQFAAQALELAVRLGATQYLALGASPAFDLQAPPSWAKSLRTFPIETLDQLGTDFDPQAISFCDAIGAPWVTDEGGLSHFLSGLRERVPLGSSLVFDYGTTHSYGAVERTLSQHGFLLYEHYSPSREINLCLAVRHR